MLYINISLSIFSNMLLTNQSYLCILCASLARTQLHLRFPFSTSRMAFTSPSPIPPTFSKRDGTRFGPSRWLSSSRAASPTPVSGLLGKIEKNKKKTARAVLYLSGETLTLGANTNTPEPCLIFSTIGINNGGGISWSAFITRVA